MLTPDGEAEPGLAGKEKKRYEKPMVRLQREIEALAGTCEPFGMDTGQDKLSFDPGSGLCRNPIT